MNVSLKIDGLIYSGWKVVNISRSLNCIASSFDLTVSDKFIGSKVNIPLNEECQILIDDKAVITGYLDEINPRYNSSTHEVTFAGRSKTCDLVDCSANIKNGQIINGTVQEIIKKLITPFNINLIFKATNNINIPDFNIDPGESVSGIIEKVCKRSGLIYTDDGYGNLVIMELGMGDGKGYLIHKINDGKNNNVLSGSGKYTTRDRFRDYYVKSQISGNDEIGGEDITNIEGHAVDTEIKRYRPLILTADSSMDAKGAEKRAMWERDNRQGKSTSFEYKVYGWQNANGFIWSPNSFITIDDDFLRIKGKLIISAVKLTTGNGTTADLQISPPETYLSSEKQINGGKSTYLGWKELRKGV